MNPNVTRDEIRDFETKHNVKLPNDFIEYYLAGSFDTGNYTNSDNYTVYEIVFLSLYGDNESIEKNMELLKDVLEGGMIPFAWDMLGSFLAIRTDNNNQGLICYYDHERNEYINLAKSFTKFIHGLS